jgi:uncharacterized OsmC-like protein
LLFVADGWRFRPDTQPYGTLPYPPSPPQAVVFTTAGCTIRPRPYQAVAFATAGCLWVALTSPGIY